MRLRVRAGHVGSALVPVLASVGFRVVVCDDCESLAVPALLPAAERIVCGGYADLASTEPITQRDYVVVLTQAHASDIDVLEGVLARRPRYVGCMGSAKKAAFVHKMLEQRGVGPGAIDSIHMPIGADIGAETPAELAVSIAAELVCVRANRE